MMLKFYFGTIIFYMIVIFSMACLFKDKMKENGWLNGAKKSNMHWLTCLVAMSSIPVVRLFVVIMMFVMGGVTKEKYEEELRKYKEDLE